MDASTIENDHAGSPALRREVVSGPTAHVDVVTVLAGSELGVEVHADADETMLVVTGEGVAELDGERTPVRAGSVVFIPRGTPHNVHNPEGAPLRLYAVHASTS
jgi:putative monooxygenase